MLYAMLVYLNEPEFQNLPLSEQERLRNTCADWHEQLIKNGKSNGALRLQPVGTATTLRSKRGRLVLTDGPFAETKEVLGGFVLLEARDLDDAIGLARTFPALPANFTLELRPVMPGGVERADRFDQQSLGAGQNQTSTYSRAWSIARKEERPRNNSRNVETPRPQSTVGCHEFPEHPKRARTHRQPGRMAGRSSGLARS